MSQHLSERLAWDAYAAAQAVDHALFKAYMEAADKSARLYKEWEQIAGVKNHQSAVSAPPNNTGARSD